MTTHPAPSAPLPRLLAGRRLSRGGLISHTLACGGGALQVEVSEHRNVSFFVKRLPVSEHIPEEYQGMWALVRIHFSKDTKASRMREIRARFESAAPVGGEFLMKPDVKPIKPKPAPPSAAEALPALQPQAPEAVAPGPLAPGPLAPVSRYIAAKPADPVLHGEGAEAAVAKGDAPINVAIRIGGDGKDAKPVTVMKSGQVQA